MSVSPSNRSDEQQNELTILEQDKNQKITLYDMFMFETKMREMIREALEPYQLASNQDRSRLV